jgi:hypothetical protein
MINEKLFGIEVRDKISGYIGKIYSIGILATGCVHIGLLADGLDKDGEPKVLRVFDEGSIELLSGKKLPNIEMPDFLCELVEDSISEYKGKVSKVTYYENSDARVTVQGTGLYRGVPVEPFTFDLTHMKRSNAVKHVEPESKPGHSVLAIE